MTGSGVRRSVAEEHSKGRAMRLAAPSRLASGNIKLRREHDHLWIVDPVDAALADPPTGCADHGYARRGSGSGIERCLRSR